MLPLLLLLVWTFPCLYSAVDVCAVLHTTSRVNAALFFAVGVDAAFHTVVRVDAAYFAVGGCCPL